MYYSYFLPVYCCWVFPITFFAMQKISLHVRLAELSLLGVDLRSGTENPSLRLRFGGFADGFFKQLSSFHFLRFDS